MSKLRTLTFLFALCALIGISLWFFTATPATAPADAIAAPRAQVVKPATAMTPPIAPVPSYEPHSTEPKSAASGVTIGHLLGSSSLDDKTVMTGLARIILETDRSLDERAEALGHLLNLATEDPAPVLLPLITNRDLPDALCDRILDDSLNAPPAWKTAACLAVLTHRKNKALKTRAHDQLAFLLGVDHGTDLAAWTKAVALSQAPPSP